MGPRARRLWTGAPLGVITALLIWPAAADASYSGQNGKLVVEHYSANCSSPPGSCTQSDAVTEVDPASGQAAASSDVPIPLDQFQFSFPSYSSDGGVLTYHAGTSSDASDAQAWVERSRSGGSALGPAASIPLRGYDVAVSPDGTRVAYDEYEGACSDVYVANIDGSGVVDETPQAPCSAATTPGYGFRLPRWSADGTKLVVEATAQPTYGSEYNRDSVRVILVSDHRPLFTQPISGVLGGFDISPDGQYVATANGCYDGTNGCASNVEVFPISGATPFAIANTSARPGQFGDQAPVASNGGSLIAFSPDGRQVAASFTPTSGPSEVVLIPFATRTANTTLWTAPVGDHVRDLWWRALPPVNADITAGPTGTSNQSSPTFEFASTTQGAVFECSLDGAGFSPCTSPDALSTMPDGVHTFKVRAHLPGQPFGTTATRTWTIDTARPGVAIDSAPSGSGNPSTVTVTFHGVPGDAGGGAISFTCSLDGAPSRPCASPDTLAGLPDGPHTVAISGTDSLGNTSASPATASWTVGAPPGTQPGASGAGGAGSGSSGGGGAPAGSAGNAGAEPPPTGSCAVGDPKVSYGMIFLVGRAGTCFIRAAQTPARTTWRTTGPVTLNGISLTPDPGSAITFTSQGEFEISGPSTVELGSLASVHIPVGIAWSADASGKLAAATGTYALVADIGGLKPIPGIPDYFPKIQLSKDNGGTATLTQSLGLPDALSALPGKPGGVSVSVTIAASNEKGVTLGGQVAVKDLYLGALHLSDLALGYDGQAQTWDGSVSLELVSGGPKVTVAATIGPPDVPALIGCCLERFSIVAENIDKPIPDTPLFLQTLGGNASRQVAKDGSSYLTIGGRAAVSIGPNIAKVGPAVLFDGSVQLSLGTPWSLDISGNAKVFGKKLAAAQAVYTHGVGVTLTGEVNETIDGYGVTAALERTYFGSDGTFNIEGTGSVTLGTLGAQSASLIFSNKGFAACATVRTPFASYALGWGELADGTSQVLSGVCDFKAYRVEAASAAATPAGEARTLILPAGRGPRLLAIRGAGSAPALTVRGPGGFAVRAGTDGSARSARALLIADPAHGVTYLVLSRPAGGRLELTSSNTAITSVRVADALPPVTVTARGRSLPNGRRRLTFTQVATAGQQLQLIEQGTGGAARLLRVTAEARGTFSYAPAAGLGARRTILAVTLEHGLPRDERIVARYTVDDRPPAPVHGLALRQGVLRWTPVARADGYLVAIVDGRGTSTTVSVRTHQLVLRRGIVSVTVEAIDALGRPGGSATLRLGAARTPRLRR